MPVDSARDRDYKKGSYSSNNEETMADVIGLLQELGFSEYEGRAYVALLRHNPLNGYELAKESGIPRPNIYAVLQKLEERNVVIAMQTSSGQRYAPVPPEDLTQRLGNRLDHVLEQTNQLLNALTVESAGDYLWNIRGYDAILEQATTIAQSAEQNLLLAVWQPESLLLAAATDAAAQRGVSILTLCLQACPEECHACRDQVYRYRVPTSRLSRWMVIVRDNSELLFAEIGSDAASALHTRQSSLIEMAGWYIRHSVALAAVVADVGGQLDTLLSPETRAILDEIGPQPELGWLDYMRDLARGGA
jgi:predicted transcriptional regulator